MVGSPEAALKGRHRKRPDLDAADILAHLAAAAVWLLVMAGVALWAPSGARFNFPWAVALPLAGVVLGLAGVLVTRAVRRLEPLESAEASAVWSPGRTGAATALAVAGAVLSAQVFSLASLEGPVRDLPGTLPSDVESLQVFGFPTVSGLARAAPEAVVAQVPALDPARARHAVNAAALAMYRGIGVRFARSLWAVGARSPEDLRGWTAQALLESLEREGGAVPRGTWVDAWVHR